MSSELTNRTAKQLLPGRPYPLGATLTSEGVNFALYSRDAAEVFLLLFDPDKPEPTDSIRLPNCTKFVWHACVAGLRAGQLYGYKVRGDHRPEEGLRFNAHKLLLDPYAKAVSGKFRNTENLLLAYDPLAPSADLSFDPRDNAAVFTFWQKAIAFTRRYTILQRRKFFLGADLDADNIPDLTWYGTDLGLPQWGDPDLRTLCCQLDGGEEKSEVGDYLLFLIFNADYRLQAVRLPPLRGALRWVRVIDTSLPAGSEFVEAGQEIPLAPADVYLANPRSTVVLLGK